MATLGEGVIRVMVVDGHRIALWGLSKLIDGERPRMEVVATATSCEEAITKVQGVLPHVVVVDAELARDSCATVIPALVNGHNARVLLISNERSMNTDYSAMLHGACGIVSKAEAPDVVLKAISKVHAGELWLDRTTTGRLFVELSTRKAGPVDPEHRKIASLTRRESDVIQRLVEQPGADNRKLANSMCIGEHTLRNHLSRIYDKLGVPNRLELYVFAQRHGLNNRTSAGV
jgi:two-component system, NarL family, nitrate/nitrite response regulator NarL